MKLEGHVGDDAMKPWILLATAVIGASAGAASAQPGVKTPSETTICLNGSGARVSVRCRTGDASRLDVREDVCICPGATRTVRAPVCPDGVAPPIESAAYAQARLKAVSNGMVSGTWEGQPMCVAPTTR
jgi:hypothetical protein